MMTIRDELAHTVAEAFRIDPNESGPAWYAADLILERFSIVGED